jgi:hypothetical protein
MRPKRAPRGTAAKATISVSQRTRSGRQPKLERLTYNKYTLRIIAYYTIKLHKSNTLVSHINQGKD